MSSADQDTTLASLKDQVEQFCQEREWDPFHGAKDLAIGTVTEASELLEIFRFLTEDQVQARVTQPESRQAIGQELADVLFFLVRFAQRYDFDLAQEFQNKMELNARKYPVDQYRGKNIKAPRV